MSLSKKQKESRLKLSSWNLPAEALEYYKKHGVEQMFPWQVQCLQTGRALKGGNLLYSAPTSAGKSLVAEILAMKRVLRTKRKAIFILPFVSVAREKMFSLRAMYSGLGLTVGGFMGSQTPPGGFQRVDVAVCTIERANSLLNRLLEADKLSQLAVIVVDELHMVGDPSRGCLLEPLLTKVNFYLACKQADPDVDISTQIIGMSATLPNMHVLAKWLEADLYCTDFRPVPLTEYVKVGSSILNDQLEYVRDIEVPGLYGNDSEMIVNLCLETIKQGKSVLIFCPAKSWCEKLATLIAKSFYMIIAGKAETSDILSGPVNDAINKDKITDLISELKRSPAGLVEQIRLCISYGTAYHHAGLTMEEKDLVESGFRKGIIRVLVATTTLSSGVNLPAQRVIIRSPMFLGKVIDALTYKQMVGRAGRKGIDSFGESVLICKSTEKSQVRALLSSDLPPATSQLIRRDSEGNYILRSSVRRALLEVIASGTAKTLDLLNQYIRCTLLAAELESNDADVTGLVEKCLTSLTDDEFILRTQTEEGSDLLTPTQLGSAVFASSMNPDESLTILCDLNKARKQFVLENELHMVYQVTPINSYGLIDWMRYLSLWETLPSDQQRVGELVGVSERFITLSHQGRKRRNTDDQQRLLQIHNRFYTALMLHDLVNEMPLLDVEKKYGVNKGTLQSLQQSAAIFAGMICTFCDRLGFTPLKLLLSDFQQRLDLGVRRELVDLIRVSCLDAKKARHFYDSGLHTVSELVNANIDQISQLLRTFLPFESSKQSHGESEWELKERSARRVYISGRKTLTIDEAAQVILDEAKQVFQYDLNQLGLNASLMHNRSVNRSSSFSTPTVTPIKPVIPTPSTSSLNRNSSSSDQNVAGPSSSTSGLTSRPTTVTKSDNKMQITTPELTRDPDYKDKMNLKSESASRKGITEYTADTQSKQVTSGTKTSSNPATKQHTNELRQGPMAASKDKVNIPHTPDNTTLQTRTNQSSKSSLFSLTQLRESSPPKMDMDILITDSQESTNQAESSTARYRQLLDKIELCISSTNENESIIRQAQSSSTANDKLLNDNDNEPVSTHLDIPHTAAPGADISIAWEEDSFTFPSQASQPNRTVKQSHYEVGSEPHTDSVENLALKPKIETQSPDLLQAVLGNVLPTHKEDNPGTKITESNSVSNERRLKRVPVSPDLLSRYTRLKQARRVRTSTVDTPRTHSRTLSKTDFNPAAQPASNDIASPCFGQSPIPSEQPGSSLNTPVIDMVTVPNTPRIDRLVVPNTPGIDRLVVPADRRQSLSSCWSPLDDSSLMQSAEKSAKVISLQNCNTNATAESNDLFSISTDSLLWSPLPEANSTSPAAKQLKSHPSTSAQSNPQPSNHLTMLTAQIHPNAKKRRQSLTDHISLNELLKIVPKMSLQDKVAIVDVCADPVLWDTFISEWAEAKLYSVSLACAPVTQYEKWIESQDSIGYHSSGETSNNTTKDDTRLSTSTFHSPEGTVLHQYNVMVCGLAVCLNFNCIFYIDLTEPPKPSKQSSVNQRLLRIRDILENPSSAKVIFDSKEHVKRLGSLLKSEFDMCSGVIDPKLGVWMLDPAEKEHNLIGLVHKLIPNLSTVVTSNVGVCIGNGSVALNPHAGTSSRLRSCYEAFSVLAMTAPLLTLLENKGLYQSFSTVEMPHLSCLAKMETDGFGFDNVEFQVQSKKILDCLNVIEKESAKYAKRCFDLGSPKDVGEVLFMELRLPFERKKVSGKRAPWSTAQAQLEKIKTLHPLPALILLWRKLHSALKTLIQPLDNCKVWCEERAMYRIYSTCSIHTATGRITMHEPNLQTIRKDFSLELEGFPELADQAISLRNIFSAPPGYQLISADYSQLELRIISHLASDPTLLELLNSGGDVFKDIASRWKSVAVDQVTDEQRQHAKQICYGIIYGMGSKALSEQLLVSEDTAEQLMNDFQSTFTGLKRYIYAVIEQCRVLGYVSTITGRRRYLPNISSTTNRPGRAQAERQAVNTTVQGSAADLVKVATINIQQQLPSDVRLVLQIHDELIYEVPNHSLRETAYIIKNTMESVSKKLGLNVNMMVRIKSGPTWAQLQEMEL